MTVSSIGVRARTTVLPGRHTLKRACVLARLEPIAGAGRGSSRVVAAIIHEAQAACSTLSMLQQRACEAPWHSLPGATAVSRRPEVLYWES